MKQIVFQILAIFLLFVTPGCKPDSNTPSPTPDPDELIARIIHLPNSTTGRPADTSAITYNSDSSIQQVTNAISSNSVTVFYYSTSLIKAISSTGSAVVRVDSIVLNQKGERIAAYILHPGGAQYDFTQYFTYNASGEVIKQINWYPNMPGSIPDTVSFVWQNGDLFSQTSTTNTQVLTYSFDLARPCRTGDILFVNYQMSIGLKRKPNAHLCTGTNHPVNGTTTINYSSDSKGRITGYTILQGQNVVEAGTYDYVP